MKRRCTVFPPHPPRSAATPLPDGVSAPQRKVAANDSLGSSYVSDTLQRPACPGEGGGAVATWLLPSSLWWAGRCCQTVNLGHPGDWSIFFEYLCMVLFPQEASV